MCVHVHTHTSFVWIFHHVAQLGELKVCTLLPHSKLNLESYTDTRAFLNNRKVISLLFTFTHSAGVTERILTLVGTLTVRLRDVNQTEERTSHRNVW